MTKLQGLGYLSPTALSIENHAVVLPCGGLSDQDPLVWTESALEKYVSYYAKGAVFDQMFGGFIFNGLSVGSGRFLHPMLVGFGEASNKEDWLLWIDLLFSAKANLYSLYEVAKRVDRSSLDIWVSIPYPHPSQEHFGNISGNLLYFTSEQHRYQAVIWWIEQFIQEWNKHPRLHERLVFRGFLWQREAIDVVDEMVVKQINQSIHQQQRYSMWLPNLGSYGYRKSKELGFDVTAVGSNYYGNGPCDMNWIHHACILARVNHTGLQIIYGKGLIYSETHLLDYLNLMVINGAIHESFFVYQLPNQSMNEIYFESNLNYKRLYSFMKKTYKKTIYPGMEY